MKAIVIAAIAILVAAGPRPLAAASSDSTRTVQPVPREPGAPPAGLSLPPHFLRDRYDGPGTGYLTLSLNPADMQWYVPPTRLDATLQGAGTAGTLGMFVGALGNTFGLFDEKTTWIIAGSLAAAGAVYGGATYEPRPRLHFDWQSR